MALLYIYICNKAIFMKQCPTCKEPKELDQYNKNKTRKDGLCRECRECQSKGGAKHYHSKKSPRLNENLKEEYKICTKCKQELHLNMFNKQNGGRFGVSGECKICLKNRHLIWNENGGREWCRIWKNNKRNTDPQHKLKQLLRLRLLDALKRHTSGGKVHKTHSAIELIGCSIEQFKQHLELQFRNGMSWSNHGKVWEIDHIKPCSSFDLTDVEQQMQCFNYINTQPLTVSENRSKKNKIL